MAIRVVIVDDQVIVREGLRAMLRLEPDIEIVGEAYDGPSAVETSRLHKPEVVLLDVKMPQSRGSDYIGPIREVSPSTRVVMLTAYDDEEYVQQAIRMGADGYALKNLSAAELVDAIRSVHAGSGYIDPAVARAVMDTVSFNTNVSSLTAREQEVLALIAEGLTNVQIAERLYLSINTVKFHVAQILRKLGVQRRTEAAVAALKQGYIPNKTQPD
ncbi:MAG: response regulator transcription factor [Firmicutes bacterium]|nr:response regulator transcription factor [Bacillota bacterium]